MGFWDDLGTSFTSPDFLNAGLTTVAGLIGNYQKEKQAQDAQNQALKLAELKLQFQQPKGGGSRGGGRGGGGGGGSVKNRNADLIEVSDSNANRSLNALNNWAESYIKAVK